MYRLGAIAAVTAVVLTFCVSTTLGDTFYADPVSGSMAGDGSEGDPWGRLEDVFAAGLVQTRDYAGAVKNAAGPVAPGDTILLLSGLHGDINLFQYFNDSPVTIAAADGETPILKRWSVTGGTHWVLRGLTVSPEPYGSLTVQTLILFLNHNFHGPVSDIVVEDCYGYSAQDSSGWTAEDWLANAGSGISVGGPRSEIRGNTVLNVGFGISVGGSDHLIEGNTIENFAGDGVRCGGDRITILYNTIKNSYVVDGNHDDAIQFFSGYGVGAADVTLRGNLIIGFPDAAYPLRHGPQGVGCFDGPYTNWVVENNIVMVDHWHGITIYQAGNCRIVNNTVLNPLYMDGQSSMYSWIDLTPQGGGAMNTVRNNISQYMMSTPGTKVTIDHNLIVPRTANPDFFFADYAVLDLRPAATSPAIDAGISTLAPAIDADKFLRPAGTAVDIGAYEYGSGPDVAVVADAGPDRTVYDTDGDGMATFTLDGSGSVGNNGDLVLWEWMFGVAVLATGETASLTLPVGAYTLTLRATDEYGSAGTDDVVITIETATATAGDADGDGDVDLDDFVILKQNFGTAAGAEWSDGDFDADGDVDLDDFVILKQNFGSAAAR